MIKDYSLFKKINILITIIEFIPLYISFLFFEGNLNVNGWSYVWGILIFLLVIAVDLGINFLIGYKIYKKYDNIIKSYFLWTLLPVLTAIIHLFIVLL